MFLKKNFIVLALCTFLCTSLEQSPPSPPRAQLAWGHYYLTGIHVYTDENSLPSTNGGGGVVKSLLKKNETMREKQKKFFVNPTQKSAQIYSKTLAFLKFAILICGRKSSSNFFIKKKIFKKHGFWNSSRI
jgi:hypothetical protein